MKHSLLHYLIYFMSGVRPFYSVAMKQTIVRAHIVRA